MGTGLTAVTVTVTLPVTLVVTLYEENMSKQLLTMVEFASKYLVEHPEGRVFASDICDLFVSKNDIGSGSLRMVQLEIASYLETKGFKKKVISINGAKRQGFAGIRLIGLDRDSATMHPQTEALDTFLRDHLEYSPSFNVPVAAIMAKYHQFNSSKEGHLTVASEVNKKLRLRGIAKGRAEHFGTVWDCFMGVRLK